VSERALALRFISGRFQGGEYPLKESGVIVIGRASGLDLVLAEDMVSRKHARLAIAPGAITIDDLGSTNGTFVNGEKVTRATLKQGDRILIGTNIVKLVRTGRTAAANDSRTAQQHLEKTAAAAERRGTSRSAVQGQLSEVPLVDLLQLLSTSKKTGAVVISGADEGRVHLRNGQVVYATVGTEQRLAPTKALYRMLGWSEGEFEFVPHEGELPPFPDEIVDPTQQLIMQAMQQLDELQRVGFSMGSRLSLPIPLGPPLRALTADEIELVQLAHNHGVVQTVLDRASGSDAEVAQKLASLVERGYLKRS
jgi:pSer/pThr/pTyr-binding forkhead associated (FHA) protein